MEEKGRRKREVVLLVEDDPHDAMLVERSFRKGGLRVSLVVARDGKEALDYLAGAGRFGGTRLPSQPKLVLLDLKLTGMDGFEFLKEVKGDPALSSIPVVVLTSSSQWEDVNRAYELGASAYLVKPLKFEDFMEMMEVVGRFWISLNVTSHGDYLY